MQRALTEARALDRDLIDAQQARRVLDRLVGYQISPLLSKTMHKPLSAGRVQSVALRLVVEREREIRAFVPVEYWSLEADLQRRNAARGRSFARGSSRSKARIAELKARADVEQILARAGGRRVHRCARSRWASGGAVRSRLSSPARFRPRPAAGCISPAADHAPGAAAV